MIRGTLLTLGAALAVNAAQAQTSQPSFDCAKATTPLEKTICSKPELAQLDLEVARAYARALIMMDSRGKKELKRDQDAFNVVRNAGVANPDFDLEAHMTLRRDFLRSVREPKGKLSGSWANLYGSVEIVGQPDGAYKVRVHTAEPAAGRWLCEFDDSAVVKSGFMIVGAESAAETAGGPNEGWTLALKLAGDTLSLEALRPKGFDRPMPFCGANGFMSGTFFALADVRAN